MNLDWQKVLLILSLLLPLIQYHLHFCPLFFILFKLQHLHIKQFLWIYFSFQLLLLLIVQPFHYFQRLKFQHASRILRLQINEIVLDLKLKSNHQYSLSAPHYLDSYQFPNLYLVQSFSVDLDWSLINFWK